MLAGRDLVMIETVGVGQDEIDIVRLADVTIVILVPGMGDDVQTIKAGIMEIADIFVINKSDRDGAESVEREIRAMQSLAMRKDDWTPPIVKTVASDGKGIEELAATIANYETICRRRISCLNAALKTGGSGWSRCCVTRCWSVCGRNSATDRRSDGGRSRGAQARSVFAGGRNCWEGGIDDVSQLIILGLR